jgi:hypothetical protein
MGTVAIWSSCSLFLKQNGEEKTLLRVAHL